MSEEAGAHQWPTLDQWWDSYVELESSLLTTPTFVSIEPQRMTGKHKEIDPWWDEYVDLGAVLNDPPNFIVDQLMADYWADLEPWWETYIEARADDIADLESAFAESDALWEQRGRPFDADPLSTDLKQRVRAGDPINPGKEVDWSDWLAQLLRADSGEFHSELFGRAFSAPSRRVEREAYLPVPTGIDRYADILSLHESGGISIEVKIGDKNLGKTTDTTALVEDQRYGDWHHYLLLPKDDLWAVNESFDEEMVADDGDRVVIHSEKSDNITLLYWSDVSRALRTVLLKENKQDSHWSASAFLFCAQIERERLGFTPEPVIEQMGTGSNRVQSFESVSVVIDDIETQVEYLTEFTEDTNE